MPNVRPPHDFVNLLQIAGRRARKDGAEPSLGRRRPRKWFSAPSSGKMKRERATERFEKDSLEAEDASRIARK